MTFLSVFYAAGGADTYPAYRWNIDTGAVTTDDVYRSLVSDTLVATGEVIAPGYDENLPAVEFPVDAGPIPRNNTLQAYDPDDSGRHTFYNDAEISLVLARFIQNGERILTGGFDPARDYAITWRVLERDGRVLYNFQPADNINTIFSTPDGLAYIDQAQPYTLVHLTTRDDSFQSQTVWTAPTPGFPKLVFVQSDAAPPESYMAWGEM